MRAERSPLHKQAAFTATEGQPESGRGAAAPSVSPARDQRPSPAGGGGGGGGGPASFREPPVGGAAARRPGSSPGERGRRLPGQGRPPWLCPEGCSCEDLLLLLKMPSRTSLAASIPSSKVKYSKLACTDEGYIDLQFKKSPPKVPYKAIALATVLFLIGTLLIIIGALLLAGYISHGGTDRAVPVLIIGILVFLPGFYHLRIAYFASKGYRGYSYDDIPDFDD